MIQFLSYRPLIHLLITINEIRSDIDTEPISFADSNHPGRRELKMLRKQALDDLDLQFQIQIKQELNRRIRSKTKADWVDHPKIKMEIDYSSFRSFTKALKGVVYEYRKEGWKCKYRVGQYADVYLYLW